MNTFAHSILFGLFLSFNLNAKLAPKDMKEFNKKCPTPKLCSDIYGSHEKCVKSKFKSCNAFVENLRKSFPEYDCQRDFDRIEKSQYIVPAIWLCDGYDQYFTTLSKVQSLRAQGLYGSKLFQGILDGHIAEEHLEQSKQVEKNLKNKARK